MSDVVHSDICTNAAQPVHHHFPLWPASVFSFLILFSFFVYLKDCGKEVTFVNTK